MSLAMNSGVDSSALWQDRVGVKKVAFVAGIIMPSK
jgi:hypothetical protein